MFNKRTVDTVQQNVKGVWRNQEASFHGSVDSISSWDGMHIRHEMKECTNRDFTRQADCDRPCLAKIPRDHVDDRFWMHFKPDYRSWHQQIDTTTTSDQRVRWNVGISTMECASNESRLLNIPGMTNLNSHASGGNPTDSLWR